MNAYQIMGFVLLLNFVISGFALMHDITDGHFYDIGSNEVNETKYDTNATYHSDTPLVTFIKSEFGLSLIAGAVGGAILGSIVSVGTRVPADSAFAYSVFSTTYWSTSLSTISIIVGFTQQGSEIINAPIFIVVLIFLVVLGFSFISFLIQLIKGGWSTYL